MINKMIVITSINPYSREKIQLECFKKWKNLGYIIRTINVKFEAEKLLDLGLKIEEIIVVDDSVTNYEIFKKKIPRIKSCFDFFKENKNKTNQYLLINSDIYPAFFGSVNKYFKNISSGIGFTRKEVDKISILSNKIDYKHYRGGVDGFYFDEDGLKQIIPLLESSEIYSRMTFGIPGWS